MSGAEQRVSVRLVDGVADVRLTRPEKRNALDPAMMEQIIAAGEEVRAMAGARAVVLSGEGASFCAGLDLTSMRSLAGDGGPRRAVSEPSEGEITHRGQKACWVWQELAIPVVAAVQGHALGGGLQIALAADVRVMHPDTQLSLREVYWGVVPDGTGSLTLARLVRADVLKDLMFSARVFDGREALELGVATRLSETPYEDAMALARTYAERSPAAVRAAKELANHLLYAQAADQFAAERRLIHGLAGGAEQAEAVRAHFEQRAPDFG
ncbi:MAG TPA: crotonase/enoyl-CoA hydratase family protein [Streptosporangiaceae bacterium]